MSRPGRINLFCGAGNRIKISFASGQHEIQQRRCRMYNYTSVYNFTCVFVCTAYAIKHIDNRKSLQKCSSDLRLRFCNFWNTRISTKLISNITCVYVNKKIIRFQSCFGVLPWLSQGKGQKNFSHSKFPCGNIFLASFNLSGFDLDKFFTSFHSVLLRFVRQSV